MNYKKTWFGWLTFLIGTLFMGVFLFASLVSMFEFSGLTMFLFDLHWLKLSYIVSVAVIGAIVGVAILFNFVKKKIPIEDNVFDGNIASFISNFLIFAILSAGLFLRISAVSSVGDISNSKYLDKIYLLFDGSRIADSDCITGLYCHIGAFLFRVFGTGSYCLQYFNILLQLFAFVFLLLAIKYSFGKTVAIISFAGMFLLPLPLEYINKISPDSLILFIVSFALLTMTLLLNDWSVGLMKSNSNIVLLSIVSAFLGLLIYLNPIFVVLPIYFAIRSLLIVREKQEASFVNRQWVPGVIWLIGSIVSLLLIILTIGLLKHDVARAFSDYYSLLGVSSILRFFIYPTNYLISSIVIFAFGFLGFIYFIFSDSDYISHITVLFILIYAVFAKNMISYDLSIYLAVLFALFMGIGVKKMFLQGFGGSDILDEEDNLDIEIEELSDDTEEEIKEVAAVEIKEENKENINEVNNEIEDKTIEIAKEDNVDDSVESIVEEAKEAIVEPVKPIKFIENVLPMPKPHVKKKMDYAFEPSPSEMDYDFMVLDDDDFDLP